MNKKNLIMLLLLIVGIAGRYAFHYFSALYECKKEFPKITGNYSVGSINYPVLDVSRKDNHAPQTQRELLLQIFYPINPNNRGEHQSYMDGILPSVKEDLKKAKKDIKDKDLLCLDTLKTNAFRNAPIATEEQIYPIILFSPGFGMPVGGYTAILEDLASHGYIVIGINYPYVTSPVLFPDGRIISPLDITSLSSQEKTNFKKKELSTWISDVIFVIDQLAKINENPNSILHNHLNTNAIGVLGHSFGAQIIDQVCRIDARCKAAVNIEGKIAPENAKLPVPVPFLFLMAPHTVVNDDIAIEQLWRTIKQQAPSYYFIIQGADHGTFTDFNYLLSPWFTTKNLDPLRGLTITRAVLVDFFDTYLKGEKSTSLEYDTGLYRELIVKK